MAEIRIGVVALRIDVVPIDVQDDVLRLDHLITLIGPGRDIDDDDPTRRARQLEAREIRRVLGLLPEEMEITQALVSAFLVRLEDVLDCERGLGNAGAPILRPQNACHFRIIDHRFAPTHALDFRTGFERDHIDGSELALAHGILSEFSSTVLEFAFAPPQDLQRTAGRRNMAERSGLEILPKLGVGDGNQRQVALIIDPRDLADIPLAAATFLQANESAVVHFVSGRQNLTFPNNGAGLLRLAGALAPGLIVIILLAGDLDGDDRFFPFGIRAWLVRGGLNATSESDHRKEENRKGIFEESKRHSRDHRKKDQKVRLRDTW